MHIVSENYSNIDVNDLLKLRAKLYNSIINKLHIYNTNYKHNLLENTHYNTTIYYSAKEQADIKDMFKMIRELLCESLIKEMYVKQINEGISDIFKGGVDKAKAAVANAKQKMQDWTNEKRQLFAAKINPKLAEGLKIIDEIIKSGVKTAKELGLKMAEIFSKLGDNVRDCVIRLGGFGDGAVTDDQFNKLCSEQDQQQVIESYHKSLDSLLTINFNTLNESVETLEEFPAISEEELFDSVTKNMKEDEKTFFGYLIDYIKSKYEKNESALVEYNEAELNEKTFSEIIKSNKLMGLFLTGRVNGKNISGWKRFLVSCVGSAVLFGIGCMLPAVGVSAATSTGIIAVTQMFWCGRGALSIIFKRATLLRPGEKMFQDKKFIISLALTTSVAAFTVIAQHLGITHSADDIKAIHNFCDAHRDHPATMEEANKFLLEHPRISGVKDTQIIGQLQLVIDPTELQAALSNRMQGVHSGAERLETMVKAAEENPNLLLSTAHNLASNIAYKGGTPAFVNDNMSTIASKSGLSVSEIKGYISDRFTFTSSCNGQTTCGSNLPSDSDGAVKFYETIAAVAKEKGVAFNFKDLDPGPARGGALMQTFVKFAAKATPVAALLSSFFAIFDFMGTDDGYIVASLGAETTQNSMFLVDSCKLMTLKELASSVGASADLVKAEEEKQAKAAEDNKAALDSISDKDKETLANAAAKNEAIKNKVQLAIDNCKIIGDPKENKVAVWYGRKISDKDVFELYDSDAEKVEAWKEKHAESEPLLFLNPTTMTGYDLAPSPGSKQPRKNPWYFKGIQNHLTVKPLFNDNKNTKEYIGKMFGGIINNGIDIILNTETFKAGKYINRDNKKYVPAGGINAKENLMMFGNLSAELICAVKNKEMNPFELTASNLASDLRISKKGNISTINRHDNIDGEIKDAEYVDKAILPVISNVNTDVYKAIIKYADEHEDFKKLFIKDNEAVKESVEFNAREETAKVTPENLLNIDNIKKYEYLLRRSMSAYGQMIDQSTIGKFSRKLYAAIEKKLQKEGEKPKYSAEDLVDNWKDIAALSHIIWKFKGIHSKWEQQCKLAGVILKKNKTNNIADTSTNATDASTNDSKLNALLITDKPSGKSATNTKDVAKKVKHYENKYLTVYINKKNLLIINIQKDGLADNKEAMNEFKVAATKRAIRIMKVAKADYCEVIVDYKGNKTTYYVINAKKDGTCGVTGQQFIEMHNKATTFNKQEKVDLPKKTNNPEEAVEVDSVEDTTPIVDSSEGNNNKKSEEENSKTSSEETKAEEKKAAAKKRYANKDE